VFPKGRFHLFPLFGRLPDKPRKALSSEGNGTSKKLCFGQMRCTSFPFPRSGFCGRGQRARVKRVSTARGPGAKGNTRACRVHLRFPGTHKKKTGHGQPKGKGSFSGVEFFLPGGGGRSWYRVIPGGLQAVYGAKTVQGAILPIVDRRSTKTGPFRFFGNGVLPGLRELRHTVGPRDGTPAGALAKTRALRPARTEKRFLLDHNRRIGLFRAQGGRALKTCGRGTGEGWTMFVLRGPRDTGRRVFSATRPRIFNRQATSSVFGG